MVFQVEIYGHSVRVTIPAGYRWNFSADPVTIGLILERFDEKMRSEPMYRHILSGFQMVEVQFKHSVFWHVRYERTPLYIDCHIATEQEKEEIVWGNLEFEISLTESWELPLVNGQV